MTTWHHAFMVDKHGIRISLGKRRPNFWPAWLCTILASATLFFTTTQGHTQEGSLVPFDLSGGSTSAEQTAEVQTALVANVAAVQPGAPLFVGVQFTLAEGYHIYHRSPGDNALPTLVQLKAPAGFQVGPMRFPKPKAKTISFSEDDKITQFVYESNLVVAAEVTPPANLDTTASVVFTATVHYQACTDETCLPPQQQELQLALPVKPATAQVSASSAADLIKSSVRKAPIPGDQSPYIKVRAVLNQEQLVPGAMAYLGVVVQVEKGFHIQPHDPKDKNLIGTVLEVEPNPDVQIQSPQYPPPLPVEKKNEAIQEDREYRGELVIRVPVELPKEKSTEKVTFFGSLRYQACNEKGQCFAPNDASFELTVPVGSGPIQPANESYFQADYSQTATPVSMSTAEQKLKQDEKVTPAAATTSTMERLGGYAEYSNSTLAYYFGLSILGGFLLNFMPCVLPVIGIKVLSFVQQAGQDRSRVFLLNLVYSFGVISVFVALGAMAAIFSKQYGFQFQDATFSIVMAGIVFAFALSLLGVYEVPALGWSNTQHHEGWLGAFSTGVLATFLATPCLGPFLGTVLAWSATQPIAINLSIWACLGLGMSLPYLLFGINPSLLRWMPRPGVWMERFKQGAGFVLVATVLFLISYLRPEYFIPTALMLFGISVWAWLMGTYGSVIQPPKTRWSARGIAAAIVAGITYFSFTVVLHETTERRARDERSVLINYLEKHGTPEQIDDLLENITWKPFSDDLYQRQLANQKTILIDFTADWCSNCIYIEKTVLDTAAVQAKFKELGMVIMKADFTLFDPQIEQYIKKFGGAGVPLTVIIPQGDENKAIAIDGVYTQADLMTALEKAGPSVPSKSEPTGQDSGEVD